MKKIHYGWVICITCTLLLFVTMGTVSNNSCLNFFIRSVISPNGFCMVTLIFLS